MAAERKKDEENHRPGESLTADETEHLNRIITLAKL